jgi:hypothetical protein
MWERNGCFKLTLVPASIIPEWFQPQFISILTPLPIAFNLIASHTPVSEWSRVSGWGSCHFDNSADGYTFAQFLCQTVSIPNNQNFYVNITILINKKRFFKFYNEEI